jgi:acyl-coenzyme A synthetase/AMP-(fatty) acid ligase
VPVRIALIDDALPRTSSGKVVKRDIPKALPLGDLLQPNAG